MPTRLVVLSAVAAALSGHARADVLTVAQVLPLEGSAELSTRSIADTADIARENRPPLLAILNEWEYPRFCASADRYECTLRRFISIRYAAEPQKGWVFPDEETGMQL
ncbi:hypothetical protein [Ralstonia solanacearum]|uniref:hypothetical protein n=1 Tax=Ralstonia solanacearum TaxID=305 RepID=UPI0012DA8AE6|nr:hypothetical protein [Ralstonia solanacearum]